jgi:hypothetical protein
MVDYSSTLLGRTKVAEDTVAFQLERPSGFQFKAGQYIDLTLLGSDSGRSNGLTHSFSIASAVGGGACRHDPNAGYSFQAYIIDPTYRYRGQDQRSNGLIYSS